MYNENALAQMCASGNLCDHGVIHIVCIIFASV